jgi:hypothetical protein
VPQLPSAVFELFVQSSRTIAAGASASASPDEGSEFTPKLPTITSGSAFYGRV